MPQQEDLRYAYSSYHTHHQPIPLRTKKGLAEFIELILRKIHNFVLLATPICYERERLHFMFVRGLPLGRILDVGCGNGNRLVSFQKLGWDAEGQEVDPNAASEARNVSGVPVHLGPLEEVGFPDASFDVVTGSHVIEHAYDPVSLLKECRRILRPEGILVITTPNGESYGHGRFRASWRGLEPPRHLHLFSRQTLLQTAVQAGFVKCDTWTTAVNASGFVLGSYQNEAAASGQKTQGANLKPRIMAAIYQFRTSVYHRRYPHSGEECILKATR
jgi:2-polyprenyl-3-methyl-5-hydroxy-6-metoxy-1,4-benzoquinol methylase